jgi:hypothetical protein
MIRQVHSQHLVVSAIHFRGLYQLRTKLANKNPFSCIVERCKRFSENPKTYSAHIRTLYVVDYERAGVLLERKGYGYFLSARA